MEGYFWKMFSLYKMLGPATMVKADEEEEDGSDVIVLVGPECVDDGLVGLFCFITWDLRGGDTTKLVLMGFGGRKHLVLTMLWVGVKGAGYVGFGTEAALLGDGGGEKPQAASGTLCGATIAGSMLPLRYPISTDHSCHVCAKITAMSQLNISFMLWVTLAYSSRFVLMTVITFGAMFQTVGLPPPGWCSLWIWNVIELTAHSSSNFNLFPWTTFRASTLVCFLFRDFIDPAIPKHHCSSNNCCRALLPPKDSFDKVRSLLSLLLMRDRFTVTTHCLQYQLEHADITTSYSEAAYRSLFICNGR